MDHDEPSSEDVSRIVDALLQDFAIPVIGESKPPAAPTMDSMMPSGSSWMNQVGRRRAG
jgi:hypothetical protein